MSESAQTPETASSTGMGIGALRLHRPERGSYMSTWGRDRSLPSSATV